MDHDAAAPAPLASAKPFEPPRLSRTSRRLGAVVALLLMLGLGGLAWYLAHRTDGEEGGPPGASRTTGGRGPATTVGVAKATTADIPVTLEALGTVTPTASVIIKPQVSGVLQQVAFREGDMVRAGQLLAVIDPRPFELALTQASGQRQRDEAQLDSARLTLARYRTLLSQDSIARQEVDTQAALVKQLEGTVMTDKAAEGTARLNLAYSRVTSPVGGRVGLRAVDVGNVVGPGDAEGLAVVTQLSPIDVEFAVPQDMIEAVQQAGGAARTTALDRTRQHALDQGTFQTLDNQVDTQTGTVRAKARFSNAQGKLFPNQFVNVQLLLRTIDDAVVVPVAALRNSANGDFVYVLDRSTRTVSQRRIQRGQATADQVVVASGLKVGEEVITEGADRLKDGAAVTLPGDKPAARARAGGPGAPKEGAGRSRRASGAAEP